MSPSISSVSFFCLLVLLFLAQHDASSYASYKQGSTQVFLKTPGKSSGKSQPASTVPPATTCSSMASGLGNNKLPVVHRLSPCSPLHGLPSLSTADDLHRDTSLVGHRFSSQSSMEDAQAPVIIPTNGSSESPELRPGELDYIVVISYGMPQQQFPLYLGAFGASMLRCKPCTSGSDECDPAFDTSRSSTFAHVLCGSLDCPTKTNCSNGSICPFKHGDKIKGTFAEDVLTLAPSMAIQNFRFACMDVNGTSDGWHWPLPEVGTLDLSRNRNSLPSQLSSSGLAPATFSYCLPQSTSSQGFLALGGNATIRNGNYNLTVHAPLVNSSYPELSYMYFIDVVGMRLNGEDLAITFGRGNARTAINLRTTFTWMVPNAYDVLRDAFLLAMSQYNNFLAPGIAGFDTCFNFTGFDEELIFPGIEFKFKNGEYLEIREQMLYFNDPAVGAFGLTCLAFSSMDTNVDVFSAFIGTYTLRSTEVVYDVARGIVGFIYDSC